MRISALVRHRVRTPAGDQARGCAPRRHTCDRGVGVAARRHQPRHAGHPLQFVDHARPSGVMAAVGAHLGQHGSAPLKSFATHPRAVSSGGTQARISAVALILGRRCPVAAPDSRPPARRARIVAQPSARSASGPAHRASTGSRRRWPPAAAPRRPSGHARLLAPVIHAEGARRLGAAAWPPCRAAPACGPGVRRHLASAPGSLRSCAAA